MVGAADPIRCQLYPRGSEAAGKASLAFYVVTSTEDGGCSDGAADGGHRGGVREQQTGTARQAGGAVGPSKEVVPQGVEGEEAGQVPGQAPAAGAATQAEARRCVPRGGGVDEEEEDEEEEDGEEVGQETGQAPAAGALSAPRKGAHTAEARGEVSQDGRGPVDKGRAMGEEAPAQGLDPAAHEQSKAAAAVNKVKFMMAMGPTSLDGLDAAISTVAESRTAPTITDAWVSVSSPQSETGVPGVAGFPANARLVRSLPSRGLLPVLAKIQLKKPCAVAEGKQGPSAGAARDTTATAAEAAARELVESTARAAAAAAAATELRAVIDKPLGKLASGYAVRFLLNYVLPALHLEDSSALGKQLKTLDDARTAGAGRQMHLTEDTVKFMAEISNALRKDAKDMLAYKNEYEGKLAAARLEASKRTRSGDPKQQGKKPTLNKCGLDEPSAPSIPKGPTITSSEREACEAIAKCMAKLRALCDALADLRVLMGLRDGPAAAAPRFWARRGVLITRCDRDPTDSERTRKQNLADAKREHLRNQQRIRKIHQCSELAALAKSTGGVAGGTAKDQRQGKRKSKSKSKKTKRAGEGKDEGTSASGDRAVGAGTRPPARAAKRGARSAAAAALYLPVHRCFYHPWITARARTTGKGVERASGSEASDNEGEDRTGTSAADRGTAGAAAGGGRVRRKRGARAGGLDASCMHLHRHPLAGHGRRAERTGGAEEGAPDGKRRQPRGAGTFGTHLPPSCARATSRR